MCEEDANTHLMNEYVVIITGNDNIDNLVELIHRDNEPEDFAGFAGAVYVLMTFETLTHIRNNRQKTLQVLRGYSELKTVAKIVLS